MIYEVYLNDTLLYYPNDDNIVSTFDGFYEVNAYSLEEIDY